MLRSNLELFKLKVKNKKINFKECAKEKKNLHININF